MWVGILRKLFKGKKRKYRQRISSTLTFKFFDRYKRNIGLQIHYKLHEAKINEVDMHLKRLEKRAISFKTHR